MCGREGKQLSNEAAHQWSRRSTSLITSVSTRAAHRHVLWPRLGRGPGKRTGEPLSLQHAECEIFNLGTLITFPSRSLVQNAIRDLHYKQGLTSSDDSAYHIRFKMHDDYMKNELRIHHNFTKGGLLRLPREIRDNIWAHYFDDELSTSNGAVPLLYVCRLVREECFLHFVNSTQPYYMPPTTYIRWKTFEEPVAGIKTPTMLYFDQADNIIAFRMSFSSAAKPRKRYSATLDFYRCQETNEVDHWTAREGFGLRGGQYLIEELTRCILNGAIISITKGIPIKAIEEVFKNAKDLATNTPRPAFEGMPGENYFKPPYNEM
ncbi:hypothetical protein KVT40_000916 [Elsinoe batatas]|uniref:Uncharacterized protein n=1 Tax=Elsinoe batatas TaxID=2601811 RepID=A0A8K0LC57_9PEZI|nr:hypothetical protein KVT40_000916 [Elsinoe batatas]